MACVEGAAVVLNAQFPVQQRRAAAPLVLTGVRRCTTGGDNVRQRTMIYDSWGWCSVYRGRWKEWGTMARVRGIGARTRAVMSAVYGSWAGI